MTDTRMSFPRKRESNYTRKLLIFFFLTTMTISGCFSDLPPEIEGMVYIPSGEFIIGSEELDSNSMAKEFGAKEKKFFENERPVRKIYLEDFYMDKFEVTNKAYKQFILDTEYPSPPDWKNGTFYSSRELHPVRHVNWFDGDSYCRWAGKRLPTEEEWEKAARGPNGNLYPWGEKFSEDKANFTKGDTVPVGTMPEDKSYYGIYDLAGNLMEWTSSWYKPYPDSNYKSEDFGERFKVFRGGTGSVVGHYNLVKIFSRAPYRHYINPYDKTYDLGFRCVKDGVN